MDELNILSDAYEELGIKRRKIKSNFWGDSTPRHRRHLYYHCILPAPATTPHECNLFRKSRKAAL